MYNNPYTGVQHSNGLLDMDIDFEPCFNWNSNLVFGWISATYETSTPDGMNTTSVTLWDIIMKRSMNNHHVKLKSTNTFYPIIDINRNLEGKHVNLTLHWEHMPVVGPIIKKSIELGHIILPKQMTNYPSHEMIEKEYDYVDDDHYWNQ